MLLVPYDTRKNALYKIGLYIKWRHRTTPGSVGPLIGSSHEFTVITLRKCFHAWLTSSVDEYDASRDAWVVFSSTGSCSFFDRKSTKCRHQLAVNSALRAALLQQAVNCIGCGTNQFRVNLSLKSHLHLIGIGRRTFIPFLIFKWLQSNERFGNNNIR